MTRVERDYDGELALVSGGAGDIGSAIGEELARRGASVVLVDRKHVADARTALDRARAHGEVRYARLDTRDRAALDDLVTSLDRLDVAVVNAGIVNTQPFLEMTDENWHDHLDVNLTGTFRLAQVAARRMVADGVPGRIVLTSSWAQEVPWPGLCAYGPSKAGVRMLGRSMALELAEHGIRVNVVAPGIVNAGMAAAEIRTNAEYRRQIDGVIPLGELQQPQDVAAAVAFIASPAAGAITGESLLVDGGASLLARPMGRA